MRSADQALQGFDCDEPRMGASRHIRRRWFRDAESAGVRAPARRLRGRARRSDRHEEYSAVFEGQRGSDANRPHPAIHEAARRRLF